MIFYLFVNFNILTTIHLELKARKVVFISTDILSGIDKTKKKIKKTTLVVKRRSIVSLEVKEKQKTNETKVSCVFKIFLNVFQSRPVPDYRISKFIFLVPKVHFSQSQAFNFQNFMGKQAQEGPKNSRA